MPSILPERTCRVEVSYGIGPSRLIFSKDLLIVPSLGMTLIDIHPEGDQIMIYLVNDRGIKSEIFYIITTDSYEVCVRTNWFRGLDPTVVDDTIKAFEKLGWNRLDSVDPDRIKFLTRPE